MPRQSVGEILQGIFCVKFAKAMQEGYNTYRDNEKSFKTISLNESKKSSRDKFTINRYDKKGRIILKWRKLFLGPIFLGESL